MGYAAETEWKFEKSGLDGACQLFGGIYSSMSGRVQERLPALEIRAMETCVASMYMRRSSMEHAAGSLQENCRTACGDSV